MPTLVAVFVLVWFITYIIKLAYVWWTGNGTIERTPNNYITSGMYIPHFKKKG